MLDLEASVGRNGGARPFVIEDKTLRDTVRHRLLTRADTVNWGVPIFGFVGAREQRVRARLEAVQGRRSRGRRDAVARLLLPDSARRELGDVRKRKVFLVPEGPKSVTRALGVRFATCGVESTPEGRSDVSHAVGDQGR